MRWLRRWFAGKRSGLRGERRAATFLRRQGYHIVARNLRVKNGEIDLVALTPDRRMVVIVEVKSGQAGNLPPEVHVNRAKQRKLITLAGSLLRRKGMQGKAVRFDVIAVEFQNEGDPIIRHHPGAFESHV